MYNNPYGFPYINTRNMMGMTPPKTSFLKSFSNIKWGNLLNNTQKTLNVINQAIPVYYQIKPIYNNIKSFGKIMSAMNEPDQVINNNQKEISKDIKKDKVNQPTFFIN